MTTQTRTRMHQCRCIIVGSDGDDFDRCGMRVPLDSPFCDRCEQHHQRQDRAAIFSAVPVGQP